MTPEQLEAQSRAAIKAWCDDPSVRLEYKIPENDVWYVCNHYETFSLRAYHYRIAKPRKFYRVGQFIDGSLIMIRKEALEKEVQDMTGFTEWLDERKYYD